METSKFISGGGGGGGAGVELALAMRTSNVSQAFEAVLNMVFAHSHIYHIRCTILITVRL